MLLSEIEAELKNLSKGTSKLAHELRTVITAVLGEAQTLCEEIDRIPPDLQETVRLLSDDSTRLRDIVSRTPGTGSSSGRER